MNDPNPYSGRDISDRPAVELIRERLEMYVRTRNVLVLMLQEAICFSAFGDGPVSVIAHQDSSYSVTGPYCIPARREGHRRPLVEEMLCDHHFGCPRYHPSCIAGPVLTNACSRHLILDIADGNDHFRQEFAFGVPLDEMHSVAKTAETWQRLTYHPDYDLLPSSTLDWDVFRKWFDLDKCDRPDWYSSDPPCSLQGTEVTCLWEASGVQEQFVFTGGHQDEPVDHTPVNQADDEFNSDVDSE